MGQDRAHQPLQGALGAAPAAPSEDGQPESGWFVSPEGPPVLGTALSLSPAKGAVPGSVPVAGGLWGAQ